MGSLLGPTIRTFQVAVVTFHFKTKNNDVIYSGVPHSDQDTIFRVFHVISLHFQNFSLFFFFFFKYKNEILLSAVSQAGYEWLQFYPN